MSRSIPISAVILFKGAQDTLPRTLESLRELDEVLIFDNGPTPDLARLCLPYKNIRIVSGEFLGFGPTRNHAARLARNDWIFMIDSDEWIDETLCESLRRLAPDDKEQVFGILRQNIYLGEEMRWGRWKPHRIMRLYHRGHTRYNDRQVHERLIVPKHSTKQMLSGVLWHESVRSVEQELEKINHYTQCGLQDAHRASSSWGAVGHAVWGFIRSYFVEFGFLDGWRGLLCAVNTANSTFYKHIKRVAAQAASKQKRSGSAGD